MYGPRHKVQLLGRAHAVRWVSLCECVVDANFPKDSGTFRLVGLTDCNFTMYADVLQASRRYMTRRTEKSCGLRSVFRLNCVLKSHRVSQFIFTGPSPALFEEPIALGRAERFERAVQAEKTVALEILDPSPPMCLIRSQAVVYLRLPYARVINYVLSMTLPGSTSGVVMSLQAMRCGSQDLVIRTRTLEEMALCSTIQRRF
jgi:hypothetical protein